MSYPDIEIDSLKLPFCSRARVGFSLTEAAEH